MRYDIGIIGLGVMGSNFAKNLINCNVSISAFDVDVMKAETAFKDYNSDQIRINESVQELCESLKKPRKILLIIPAGKIVDDVLGDLRKYLSAKDIIVDMGNSSHLDTIAREEKLSNQGLRYLGCGFSGGELGALNGPSLMLSGDYDAYEKISAYLKKAAAKDKFGNPCIGYIGKSGAGHFVKLVHNGIEYAELQLISEIYGFLKNKLNMNNIEVSEVFKKVSKGILESYLLRLASIILEFKDPEFPENFLLNRIKGEVQQKGTGFMISLESIRLKAVAPSIITSVLVRFMSNEGNVSRYRNQSEVNANEKMLNESEFVEKLRICLVMLKHLIYHQGFDLIKKSNEHYNWNISINNLINVWKKGSILESEFLYEIDKYDLDKNNILDNENVSSRIREMSLALKEVVKTLTEHEAYCPLISTTYQYWLSMTDENNSLNIIQGMRDAFGSHTFELEDREGAYHTNWLESEGEKVLIKIK